MKYGYCWRDLGEASPDLRAYELRERALNVVGVLGVCVSAIIAAKGHVLQFPTQKNSNSYLNILEDSIKELTELKHDLQKYWKENGHVE